MAWIKVEYHTPEKPEMARIARACSCSIGDAFLAWFKVWRALDATTEDGHQPGTIPEDLDAAGGLPGIGRALLAVGWIQPNHNGLQVVNWDRHNGRSSKARACANRRMAAWRGQTKR